MGRIVVRTLIGVPRERCFDLARDVDVHCRTSSFTAERVVPPGRTSGRLELGDLVVFEGRHFGARLRLSARITEMNPPARFVDEVLTSPFRRLRHVHEFASQGVMTEMIDSLTWESPLGVVGRIADAVLIEPHMRWYVTTKQRALKRLAEGDRS